MSKSTLTHKQAVVQEIKEAIENSKSISIVEYRGLNVADISELRKQYREAGVNYKVYKNTLVNIALSELGYEGYEEYLSGPNGFVFSNEDMVQGPKISVDFAKDHEALKVKAGIIDGKVVDADSVKALAKLPTKEVLLAQVLGGLNAPIQGFASVLNATLSSLVYALNAVNFQLKAGEIHGCRSPGILDRGCRERTGYYLFFWERWDSGYLWIQRSDSSPDLQRRIGDWFCRDWELSKDDQWLRMFSRI